ncbi:protein RST1 isoform X1 [Malania oleifera]|uniref:protein RST1 isoform X1 n=1 Tax=Malania oleifera TaxID=397392 RepID=UPI0025AE6FC9|nr:protein RST1 isoform X1 [Malania oleifera]
MDSYSSLLDRLRVPQPSLQRLAVISVFEKLRSSPSHLNADSNPGGEAISQCLLSSSPSVVDQSVRELCRLVTDSKMDISRGLLELQSALEGSDSRFVQLFVKALGFLVRFGFQNNNSAFRFNSTETHPFVKVLACRPEVQSELVHQVLLFITENKRFGMTEVCEYLRPFLNFSILRIPFSSESSSSFFVRTLIASMASLCCSLTSDAMPIFKLLIGCSRYYPCRSAEVFRNFIYLEENMVDSYIVVLRQVVVNEPSELIKEAQRCGMELLEIILSPYTDLCRQTDGREAAVELSKRLLVAQKDLGLPYLPKMLSAVQSLFVTVIQSELEHEQLSIIKLLIFLLKWKTETEYVVRDGCELNEEFLLIFPVINLMSSPSKCVKGAATDLLFILEKLLRNLLITPKKEMALQGGLSAISRPESIVFRLLQHLWFQDQFPSCRYFFVNFVSLGRTDNNEMYNGPKSWVYKLREYSLWIAERRKSSLPISCSQEVFLAEMPFLLGAIAGVLVMHHTLGTIVVDSLAAIGVLEPKLGVSLLLAILFYNNIFSNKNIMYHDMSLKLLGLLPSLASHSVMIPLVVQTIMPMLQKDAKPVLYATATRLLCKTWEINDRAFGSLQGVLLPKWFTEFMSERNICISIAASIRDVCRNNPDRGVDLILSVSACIENYDCVIQALGFQSLAHLCEADLIDFYTAWDVIAKHVLNYSADPVVAHSVCLLLRWGAMDAEAYSEASRNVLQILWEVCTAGHLGRASLWIKARASAFEALSHYEVFHIEKCIPDFRRRNIELLISETNTEILGAMEGFEVKILMHEHLTRRRLVKEKRVTGHKIEKLLNVLPQVIFSSGKNRNARDLPGAALLCFPFTPKDGFRDVLTAYESALVDIAASLQLSRNILVALFSLQSWKPFMQRWMRASILFLNAKAPSAALDRTSKAADDIMKSMRRIAEDSIPRSAENIALAMGALCSVLPPSAHAVKSAASKFLLNWLFQYEHEHRQWSAAISLGVISSCLHVTDHKQKHENITALVKVVCDSKSTFVKGACGVGLGFSCQDLLRRVETVDDFDLDQETHKVQEMDLLGKIVRTLSLMICQLTQSSTDHLRSVAAYFPPSAYDVGTDTIFESSSKKCDDLEDDIWGVAGLVLGLGSSVSAVFRAGARDAVLKIKALIIAWFLHVNHSVSDSCNERNGSVLSVGSCLVLPIVVAFCQRVELMDDNEIGHILNGFRELISELLSIKKSGIFHQSLLMASCVGAGSLLACILNEGVHSVEVEDVKSLMDLFRKCYSNFYPPSIHLGGMLGVVNAFGAGAGTLVHFYPLTSFLMTSYAQRDSSHIMGPLLSNPACEPHLTSLIQEIFLVAQNSEDHQLQQYAAWAVSFLRHCFWVKESPIDDGSFQTDAVGSKPVSQGISDDSSVMKLSLWLTNHSGEGAFSNVNTVVTVLRCLSRAPRLPVLDWGATMRRCMRYGAQFAEMLSSESALKKVTLWEECLNFSIAHASQFDALLSFLDELSDLYRFCSLELNLQSCILSHLADLMKTFSSSRLEKLFSDTADYLCTSVSSFHGHDPNQKSLLRVSCWKGLCQCLDDVSLDSTDYRPYIEKCLEVLFFSLPALQCTAVLGVHQVNSVEEWSEAVRCLGKARGEWLSKFLQVDLLHGDGQIIEVVKKIQAKAKLVMMGSIPPTDLGQLKACILNIESHVIWDAHVEVVAALQHAEGSVKRHWLVDAVEISCITNYPSTALQFLGLLAGSLCKYMPLLILDRRAVLSDLPVTLPSLFSDPSWEVIAEPVVSHLFESTKRVYRWAGLADSSDDVPGLHPIHDSEKEMAVFLMHVLHHTCVLLKDYLPLEKQLRLANMVLA